LEAARFTFKTYLSPESNAEFCLRTNKDLGIKKGVAFSLAFF